MFHHVVFLHPHLTGICFTLVALCLCLRSSHPLSSSSLLFHPSVSCWNFVCFFISFPVKRSLLSSFICCVWPFMALFHAHANTDTHTHITSVLIAFHTHKHTRTHDYRLQNAAVLSSALLSSSLTFGEHCSELILSARHALRCCRMQYSHLPSRGHVAPSSGVVYTLWAVCAVLSAVAGYSLVNRVLSMREGTARRRQEKMRRFAHKTR